MVINKDISTYKKPYTVTILDATDAYYYADVMDIMMPFDTFDDLEKAKTVSDAIFVIKNYKWESLQAMNELDAGFDVRIYDGNFSCVYISHEKFKDKWF